MKKLYSIEVRVNNTLIGIVHSASRENAQRVAQKVANNYINEHKMYPFSKPFRDEYNPDMRDFCN